MRYFILNGKKEKLTKNSTLFDFIKNKSLHPEKIVIELNGKIITKDELASIYLKENDKLEILNFMGGG